MKLSYSILWFDDTEDFFESLDLDRLKNEIGAWGLNPNIDLVLKPDEFERRSQGGIDLLVIDYNLSQYGHGETFIEKIRSNRVYTEVVFYTSGNSSDLWDAIREKMLEGIYVANKKTVLDKVVAVGEQTVRKVLDLENLRGIVMAEVGDLDVMLERILSAALPALDEDARKSIYDSFHAASAEQNDSYIAALEKFREAGSVEQLLELCDSNKRWQNVNRVAKSHPILKELKDLKRELNTYETEVLRPRNFLAHGVASPSGSGGYLFEYKGKSWLYDEKAGRELRLNLIKHRTTITKLHAALSRG